MKNRMLGVSLLALLMATGCGAGTEPTSAGDAGEAVGKQSSELATTNDLTVGYIQRVPAMDWVLNSANPKVDGWPSVGQNVTWRGFIRNISGTARNGVQYRWLWDGAQVATGSVNIAANGTASVDYVRAWDFSRHELKLVIDTANAVAEDEENNNELAVVSNALSLGLWVEQSVYDYFKAHQRDLSGVHSTCWDNWAQRQVSQWNSMLYAGAVYPESPQGVLDRVRLDKITIVPDHALPLNGGLSTNDPDLNDHSVDLEWGFPADSVAAGNTWYADTTTISLDNPFYYEKGLPHELGHARYLIDNYGFDVHQQANGQGRDGIPQTENGARVFGTHRKWRPCLWYALHALRRHLVRHRVLHAPKRHHEWRLPVHGSLQRGRLEPDRRQSRHARQRQRARQPRRFLERPSGAKPSHAHRRCVWLAARGRPGAHLSIDRQRPALRQEFLGNSGTDAHGRQRRQHLGRSQSVHER
jgi:hypothetical protein